MEEEDEDDEDEDDEEEQTAFRYYRRRWRALARRAPEEDAFDEDANASNDDEVVHGVEAHGVIRVDDDEEEEEEEEELISEPDISRSRLPADLVGQEDDDAAFLEVYVFTTDGEEDEEGSAPTNTLARQFEAACTAGNVERVRELLEAGAELHPTPRPVLADGGYDDEALYRRIPLALAASSGHLNVVDVLLRAGADVRANDNIALALASRHRRFDMVARLVQAGADVRARADIALKSAVALQHYDMLAYLLSHGAAAADLDLALVHAVVHNHNGSLCGLLLSAGARIHAVHRMHTGTPDALGAAVRGNRGLLVKTFLEHGARAPVAERQASLDKALLVACALGYTAVVRLLLAAGANVHFKEDTALRTACTYGCLNVVATLLAAGADVHARDDAALALAAQSTHNKVAALLLRAGADVRSNKYVALKEAFESMRDRPHPRRALLYERLVTAGAATWPKALAREEAGTARAQLINWVVNARALERLLVNASLSTMPNRAEVDAALNSQSMADVDLGPVFRVACATGNMYMVRRLITAGANVHDAAFDTIRAHEFSGALLAACEAGQLEAVATLVAAGASVSMCNGAPLNIAARLGKAGLVDWLVLKGAASERAHVETALISASQNGHGPVIALLLRVGGLSMDALRSAVSHAVVLAAPDGLANVRQLLKMRVDLSPLDDETLANAVRGPRQEAARLVKLLLKAGANVHAQDDLAIAAACAHRRPDLVELLLQAGASVARVDWMALTEVERVRTVLRVQRAADAEVLPLWIRFVRTIHLARVRLSLRHVLYRARVRLDRPPTGALGVASPTRAQLVAHLQTGGRRFAREYWIEGLPLFFPSLLAEFGSQVPAEFEIMRIG